MKCLLITVMATIAAVLADPAVLVSSGFMTSPFSSAALISPFSPQVVAPAPTYAQLPSYPAVAPVLSDYRYAYGSSYNYQDSLPVVNSALTLPYSLPYAYAADWFYRK